MNQSETGRRTEEGRKNRPNEPARTSLPTISMPACRNSKNTGKTLHMGGLRPGPGGQGGDSEKEKPGTASPPKHPRCCFFGSLFQCVWHFCLPLPLTACYCEMSLSSGEDWAGIPSLCLMVTLCFLLPRKILPTPGRKGLPHPSTSMEHTEACITPGRTCSMACSGLRDRTTHLPPLNFPMRTPLITFWHYLACETSLPASMKRQEEILTSK